MPNARPPKRSDLKRQLHRLIVAQSDINAARNAWQLLKSNPTQPGHSVHTSLMAAMVISYARPFVSSESFGILPRKWSTYPDSRYQKNHDALLKARNEIVAHSEQSVRKVMIVPPGVRMKLHPASSPVSEWISYIVSTYSLPPNVLETLGGMLDDVLKRMFDEIELLLNKLYADRNLPNQEFLLQMDEEL